MKMTFENEKTKPGLKRCPYCAELIQIKAIVCKHCGHNVSPQAIQSERKIAQYTALKQAGNSLSSLGSLLTILGILIICCIFAFAIYSSGAH